LLAVATVAALRLFAPSGPAAPDFTLTDQSGRPYTLSAQRGHTIALFFGYTHCPDECPATLASLATAKRRLGAAAAAFEAVMVTADPGRDTPAVLGRYMRSFDPAFVGLTGSGAQLASVYAAYHVYVRIPPHRPAVDYDVEHSTAVQFIAPDGRLRGIGDWTDSPDQLAVLMKQARS
jgi:protein SCO1/2